MLIYGLDKENYMTKFKDIPDGGVFYPYSVVTASGINTLFMKIYDSPEKNAVNLSSGFTLNFKQDTPVITVKAHIEVEHEEDRNK